MISRFKQLFTICLFIFISFTAAYSKQLDNKPTPYAMTISGGISLGNYEAGMNWAIIEIFRLVNNGKITVNPGKLVSITGASAGSINALVSALRYCQEYNDDDTDVINNLFYKTWLNVGFDGLLPESDIDYDQKVDLKGVYLKDGVLSRKPFNDVVVAIKEYIHTAKFRPGCNVRIGVSLTREHAIKTNPVKTTMINQIDVLTQRFFIPIELSINENHKVIFKNYTNMYLGENDYGNIVFLPETEQGIIADRVIAAALASSAFPVAFGRVRLEVCEKISKDKKQSTSCPDGFYFNKVVYVDGGVFDNVPLSAARLLAEDEKDKDKVGGIKIHEYDKPFSYIYMSPSNLRFTDKRLLNEVVDEDNGASLNYGIMDQMGFVGDAINIGMGSELYSTLRSYNWNYKKDGKLTIESLYSENSAKNRPRRLLLTTRGSPLTADYLSHFGAFAAREFREYDYYSGVYDGVYNASKSICGESQDKATCIIDLMEKLHKELNIKQCTDANKLFLLLYQNEKYNDTRLCDYKNEQRFCNIETDFEKHPFYVLHNTMMSSTNLDFNLFLKKLLPHKDEFNDAALQSMMAQGRLWYIDYTKRILHRMQHLEDTSLNNGDQKNAISLTRYIFNSIDVAQDDFTWAISSAPDIKPNTAYRLLIPDEIGFDISQSGGVFSYRAKWDPWYAGIYPELEGSIHIVSDVTDRSNFAHAGVNFRKRLDTFPVSSFGMGYGYYKDFTSLDWDSPDENRRISLSTGLFFDKFRITIGQRFDGDSDVRKDSRMIILGLTDVKGLMHLMFGRVN